MRKILAAVCISMIPLAMANADLDLDQLTYAGTGCPGDGKGIGTFTSSNGRIVVYTPDMNVDLKSSSFDRKACNLALPVDVAANERVVIGRPAVFGKEDLSAGESLDAAASVFFTGTSGPQAQVQKEGNQDKMRDFYNRNEDSIALGCGQDTIVRAQTTALARKTGNTSGGKAQVRGLAFDLRIEQCTAE